MPVRQPLGADGSEGAEEPGPDPAPWRGRRAATALGRAVHAVLQRVDLVTGEDLEELAAIAAASEGCPERKGRCKSWPVRRSPRRWSRQRRRSGTCRSRGAGDGRGRRRRARRDRRLLLRGWRRARARRLQDRCARPPRGRPRRGRALPPAGRRLRAGARRGARQAGGAAACSSSWRPQPAPSRSRSPAWRRRCPTPGRRSSPGSAPAEASRPAASGPPARHGRGPSPAAV